ncbi:tripartite tricarboxylate transporter substrate binding protein [Enterocloster asparagiformis]|jgi:tripartite-type tricarboxylate transporter receptor subunit TctC|uniref:Tripartite tricarboxylate transporter substrate binding protein n=2 Tax=Enterocloster asparagiformis TaxID=333367 RepID=A0A413FCY1_9FIRM|nr:tripartite tricarboxylate transporter substrate binding protein [Enterocloster asparagiformis]RGX27767.1 tripartite tricarboxylate transporter substrate binding protein [Enterocloster asparagiformis]UWO76624.1 tripartite tricarboxylate transporter substrate binding protein [[Clostridium] asparagiforme DSM 15981]
MRKRNMKAMAMVAAAALVLAGCSGGGGSATTAAKEEATTQAAASEEKATEAAADTTAAAAEKTTDYPNKPIDLVVPFAAGGNVDLSCRILAQELEKELGQPVNVLNKEGGGAVVGQTYAVTQKPDGYTMLALTSSYVTNVLSGATTYDMDSITPIAEYCFDPELIVASEASGIETIEQFMEVGKEKVLLNSTPGFSTSHHIASLIFTQKTGIEFEYMHTNGSAEQTVQLAGGHAEVGMTTYAGAASLIEQGKIKVLAICADERSDILPDVPTLKESGVDFVYGAYRGLAVPAGTPDEVVQILSDAMAKVMASEEVKTQFDNSGFPITYTDAATFKEFLANDYVSMEAIQDLIQE